MFFTLHISRYFHIAQENLLQNIIAVRTAFGAHKSQPVYHIGVLFKCRLGQSEVCGAGCFRLHFTSPSPVIPLKHPKGFI